MIGRHPDRWRLDAVGNPVLKVKCKNYIFLNENKNLN